MSLIFRKKINQNGFSLVELMVVVAIISVLATIGVPQYRKFRVKSFQVEAKSHLSGIYTAEMAFFTEFSGYHHSLKVIGYAPLGKVRYDAGFGASGTIPAGTPVEDTYRTVRSICSGPHGAGTDPNCLAVIPLGTILPGRTWNNNTSFSAAAVASEQDLELAANFSTSNTMANLALENLFGFSAANANQQQTQIPFGSQFIRFESWTINQDKVMGITHDILYMN